MTQQIRRGLGVHTQLRRYLTPTTTPAHDISIRRLTTFSRVPSITSSSSSSSISLHPCSLLYSSHHLHARSFASKSTDTNADKPSKSKSKAKSAKSASTPATTVTATATAAAPTEAEEDSPPPAVNEDDDVTSSKLASAAILADIKATKDQEDDLEELTEQEMNELIDLDEDDLKEDIEEGVKTGTTAAASSSTSEAKEDEDESEVEEPRQNLKPSELVAHLDKYIVGQLPAKKSVAVALRNRWRRHQVKPAMRQDITPKNILMVGPTGCGKTEIARRLALITDSPFIKVEATKFTETGFYGKDVDSIIKDLVRVGINQLKAKKKEKLMKEMSGRVEEQILTAIYRQRTRPSFPSTTTPAGSTGAKQAITPLDWSENARRTAMVQAKKDATQWSQDASDYRAGKLDALSIEIPVPPKRSSSSSSDEGTFAMGDDDGPSAMGSRGEVEGFGFRLVGLGILGGGGRGRDPDEFEIKSVTVAEARAALLDHHTTSRIRTRDLAKRAIKMVESDGIVFLDEIDKIVTSSATRKFSGGDASAEGVQRDLLPLVEGTVITTPHGPVNTDHILFICSGAFHAVNVGDMLPELQGRLPVRVELKALTEEDFYRILTVPTNNLIKQQSALLKTDNVDLVWTDGALREIARVACEVNRTVENIGARRLNTVIQRIMDEYSFTAADLPPGTRIEIDVDYVREKIKPLMKNTDLSKYVL